MRKLTEQQRAILEMIKPEPRSTVYISRLLGVTYSTVNNCVRRMEDRGFVRRLERYDLNWWELTSTGKRYLQYR